MGEKKRGTLKMLVSEIVIEVSDGYTQNIIKNALLENGYDLLSEPTFNCDNRQIGEKIKIYRTGN